MRLTSIFCAYSTSRINFNLLSYAWRNGVKTQNIPSPHWKKLVSWPLTPRLRDLSSASIGMVHIVRTRQSLGTGETINVSNVGPCTAFPERAVYLTRLSLQLVAAWLRAATHCSLYRSSLAPMLWPLPWSFVQDLRRDEICGWWWCYPSLPCK